MVRRWRHEVDPLWLEARKHVLTATDISNLLPEYRRWVKAKKPGDIPPGFSALWCQKATDGFEEVESFSAAARGHIMEPYAIEDWNDQAMPQFEHWDDCIVVRDGIGFSPDAMNVPQDQAFPALLVSDDGLRLARSDGSFEMPAPTEVMEVKCYEPANHMKALCTGHMDHKELMQVAVAFYVLPKLETARILWYCPNAPFPMHVEMYLRDEMSGMFDVIDEIANLYSKADENWEAILKGTDSLQAFHTEDEIYQEFVESQAPDMFVLK